jgi:hypothetical protein
MSKLYILTRRDLSRSQRAVQAGHAVAEWLLHNNSNKNWTNGTLVYLAVRNEQELNSWIGDLESKQISFVSFKEPDRNYETTAIAILGNSELFKSLPLMN